MISEASRRLLSAASAHWDGSGAAITMEWPAVSTTVVRWMRVASEDADKEGGRGQQDVLKLSKLSNTIWQGLPVRVFEAG
jgi:hypothetical protein